LIDSVGWRRIGSPTGQLRPLKVPGRLPESGR
jgi:hypothetical protein